MAALRDGRLLDYAIARPGAPELVGATLRGRIVARMPALAGAFVALGAGMADGFLPDSAGGAAAGEGAILMVRVTRAAQGGKGPRLAVSQDDAGPGPLGIVSPGPDALARLAALHADAPIAVDDAALFAARRAAFGPRMALVQATFDDALEAQVEALCEPCCELPGGGRMMIEPTSALVAIDLDLAGGSLARHGKTAAHTAANATFIPEIARQIRLRNLAGAIVVDLAGLSPRRRAALGPALAAALQPDPLRPRFLGFSALGLAEILRPRVHPPLHDLLDTPHASGLAALRTLARETAADPAHTPALRASAEISDALLADAAALATFARLGGRPLDLRTDRTLPRLAWRLEAA